MRVEATLRVGDATRATVVSTFFVQGARRGRAASATRPSRTAPRGRPRAARPARREALDRARRGGAALDPRVALRLLDSAPTTEGDAPRDGDGELLDPPGASWRRSITPTDDVDAAETEPARWFAAFAPARDAVVALPQPSAAHVERAFAPWNLAEFARASRDANPLHRDAHVAALAGFDRPIVHGQWTAARAVAAAVAGFAATDGERVRAIEVSFTDAVLPGDEVEFRARHTGMRDGELVVEVEARARDGADGERQPLALQGRIRVAAPRTAYVFPGQGVQTTGMGMEGYARSPAARRVWDEADARCRDRLGFSLLTVVRENPVEMRVGVEIHRHEQGVLFLTQFTQVAMAVLAIAQVAELRESGSFQEDALFCGHSVGEYSAIGAITDALPLAAVVECVYQRGLTMQTFVPRDAGGRSPYRMAVVRPNIVAMNERDLDALVKRVAKETGLLCEVVNLNIRGRQYSVVGHVPALELLRAQLAEREAPGSKPAYLEVPGIDVPFHSVALRDGRRRRSASKLEAYMPPGLDVTALVGRYVPNLVARPFALTRAYLDEVAACTGSPILAALQRRWDADAGPPPGLGRALFIEGLAYQFASPVRWIETQDVVLARDRVGVSRVIEVGLGAAPTQANMFRATLALDPSRLDPPAVYNVEAERKAVFHLYDAESVDAPPPAPSRRRRAAIGPRARPRPARRRARGPPSPTRPSPCATRSSRCSRSRPACAPTRSAPTRASSSSSAATPPSAIRSWPTSARSSASAPSTAPTRCPSAALVDAVQQATSGATRRRAVPPRAGHRRAQALRPRASATRSRRRHRARAPRGPLARTAQPRRAVAPRGRLHARRRALARRPAEARRPRRRGGVARRRPRALRPRRGHLARRRAAPRAAPRSTPRRWRSSWRATSAWAGPSWRALRFAEAALGRDVWAELAVKDVASEEPERLGRYDAEHGEGYERAIRPAFASEKAVVFTGAWAWARREALALYHAAARGERRRRARRIEAARIARGADEAVPPAPWASATSAARARRRRARRGGVRGLAARIDPARSPRPAERGRAPGPRGGGAPRRPPVEDYERPRGEPTAARRGRGAPRRPPRAASARTAPELDEADARTPTPTSLRRAGARRGELRRAHGAGDGCLRPLDRHRAGEAAPHGRGPGGGDDLAAHARARSLLPQALSALRRARRRARGGALQPGLAAGHPAPRPTGWSPPRRPPSAARSAP